MTPSALVTGLVAYLTGDVGPDLAGAATVNAWLPPVEPSRTEMPAVYCHVQGIPDVRSTMTGRGGGHLRTYRAVCDVWHSMTSQHPAHDQAAAADLAQLVLDKLLYEPSWGSTVTTSGGRSLAEPLHDPYEDIRSGGGRIVWRVSCDATVSLIVS